jgi:hypothetical protein
MLEDDPHAHPDAHRLGGAADDVRHEPQPRLLLDLDDRDRVRVVGRRHPGLVVQREGRDGRAARDRSSRQRLAELPDLSCQAFTKRQALAEIITEDSRANLDFDELFGRVHQIKPTNGGPHQ